MLPLFFVYTYQFLVRVLEREKEQCLFGPAGPRAENKRKHTILMGLFTFPNAPGMTGLHLGYPFLLCLGKQR